MPLSADIIASAKRRLDPVKGRTEADIRRATSDAYYALLHRLCEALVENVGSKDPENAAFKEVYKTLYRLPDHANVANRCKEAQQKGFSPQIVSFANCFIQFRTKRELADYDPLHMFPISTLRTDIGTVKTALQIFDDCDPVERTRFAFFVALKSKRK